MAFCPNLSDNDVAADFYAIVDRTNDNIAYNLWNKFEGDVDAINTFIDNRLAEATTKVTPPQSQENPIIKLAKRWNINDKGFTESNSLPKSSVEDMKKEAKELGLGIKEASSGSYYFTKGNKLIVPYRDAYQLEKEPGENPIQELQDAMIRWAERNGIEVLALEDLMKRIGANEAYDDKVVGVANILNKLIGLSENKIDITTLPEEVGHFMVEFMLNDVSVQRALDLVTKTDTYTKVKEDYKNVYTEEIDFRKEALGKILAQEVIRQFKNTANNPVRAFLNAIKTKFLKAWNSLLNRDNGRVKAELAKIVDPMAKSLLEGKVIEDTRTTEQVETSVDMLQVDKNQLEREIKTLTSNPKGIKKVETKEDRYYIDKDNNKYIGLSEIVNPSNFIDKKGEWKGAVKIGTAVDVILRGFFMNKTPKYQGEIAKRLSKKAYNELLKSAEKYKNSLRDENGKLDHIEFLTEGLFIADNSIKATEMHINNSIKSPEKRKESYGIATELDMVVINKKTGEKTIVDFKTVRVDPSKNQTVKEKLDASYEGQKSKAEGYSKQQNASRLLIAKNENIDFNNMKLLTIEVNYDKFEETTDKAEVQESLYELQKESISEVFPLRYKAQFKSKKTSTKSKADTKLDSDSEIKRKKTFLDRAISKLEGIQQLRRNISDLGTKSQKFREAQAKIDALKEDVAKARYTEGLLKFIENAETELGVMVDFLNSKNTQTTEEYSVDDKNLINLAGMAAQEYQDLIRDLTNAMDATGLTMSEEAADVLRISKNAQEYARQIAGLSLKLQKNIAVYVLEKGNLDYRGNKIDPNFDAKSIVEAAAEDLSAFRLNWGQIKNSQSNILKIAVKLINDKVNEVRRYSVGKARTLLNLQTNIKNFNSKVFYETNAKGEKTGYIVSEYNYGEYYKAMEEMRSKLAKDLGFDNPYDVIKENLSKLQLEIYTDVWEKFFDKHSQKKKVSITRNGKEVIVNKTIPSEMYKNAAYAKIKANPEMLAFYEELIKTKVEALNKLPRYLRTEKNKYLIPQVRKTFAERVSFKDIGRNLGQVIKEIGVVEEDETMFGQTGSLGSKIIPIHFNRQLDNMKDLSEDISSVYTRYAEMAENFKQMNKISGDMESVRAALHERDYTLKDERKKGAETKEYEALKNEIEKLILGVTKKAARVKVGGKEYNVTKLSENIASYFRTTNLAFNFSTSTAGFFKGSIDKLLEDQIGLYTTNSSSNWAAAEYAKNIGQVIASKSSKQKNKMHLLLEQSGVIELERIIKNTNMSRASRVLLNEQVFYSNYMMADYGMKGRNTLAIYDNIRLYKGDFVNYKTFLELKAKEKGKDVDSVRTGIKQQALGKENAEWKALRDKSLYNALEVKNGKIKVKPEFKDKVTDKVLNTADNTVNHINHILDGTLSPEDKSNVARKWWGSFILMHRGWVISGLDNRFKKGGMNFETGEWEEGYYRSFLNVTKNMIANTALNKRIGLLSAKEPSAGELRGAKKFMLDLLFMNMVAIIAAMANIKAEGDDEEEDYTWQFTAYQLNRILLETRSFFSVREFVEMIEEPVVAARAIKEMSEITTAFAFGDDDIISRGQYEDWTRGGKWWFKRTPIKNIYELQFPKTKNDYIKNIIGSSTYNLLRKEDEEEKDWWEYTPIGNTKGFTKNILQRKNND